MNESRYSVEPQSAVQSRRRRPRVAPVFDRDPDAQARADRAFQESPDG
ncbi:MAG: hypothetical protein IT175_03330 [Acidobacteria bacterium]|nr:hypothetical protein [Acidobacteriota bacterium]